MGEKIELTEENYFSKDMLKKYLSVSTFKKFVGTPVFDGCECKAMAELNGDIEDTKGTALLLGSYVDEKLLGTDESFEKFKESHPELISSRGETKGMLKAEFRVGDKMVERVQKDEKMMFYLDGEHQKIFTGTLFGTEWKIKVDNYVKGKFFSDLKTCESIRKGHWSSSEKRYLDFITAYDYILQMAIYQEIIFQNTGERLPAYIVAVSKEADPDIEVIYIDNGTLHDRIYGTEFTVGIADDVDRVRRLINGELEPIPCGHCSYCLPKKKIRKPIHYTEIMGEV